MSVWGRHFHVFNNQMLDRHSTPFELEAQLIAQRVEDRRRLVCGIVTVPRASGVVNGVVRVRVRGTSSW